MYQFILNMWIIGKVDEEKVKSYVPRYITQNDADVILSVPQDETHSNLVPSYFNK